MDKTITREISGRISRASKKIGKGLSLPQKRCIGEMFYEILGGANTKLSSIGRTLHEKIPISYTIKRISRNLKQLEITDSLTLHRSLKLYCKSIPKAFGIDKMFVFLRSYRFVLQFLRKVTY